ncbi:DUF4238 domain-containing protein [Streptomyces sp. NPDC090126]|uniref:DUF4238 domain-containing protein n=1 Tax=Streptomyces sp. NPDC090126 TaxID=3365952 RepID=UPI0038033015
MGAPKTHHLVPRYWLNAFAEDGHVVGRWRDGVEHRTRLRGAAAARHFNTDPLAEGERRTVLETYLGDRVDGPAARVSRAIRQGHWPLDEPSQQTLIEALAWQVVRTRAFRAWDEQVGEHLFPPLWATEAVDWVEEHYGRPLTPEQRLQVFNAALRQSPSSSVITDRRMALRSAIRGFERVRSFLSTEERHWVLLQSDRPLLVIGDSGVVLRRRDGTYGTTPPLLSAGSQLLVPLSPQHLLISTTRSHYQPEAALTATLAAKANTGAAHWCQEAVYRLPSMPWPARLRIPGAAPHIQAPVVHARTDDGAHPGTELRHPDVHDPELRSILQQFTGTATEAATGNSERGGPVEP